MSSVPFIQGNARGSLLEVYVQPKASRNEIAGIHQGRLKLRVTAPPVEGEANKECVKFLSEFLKIPRSSVEVIRGHKSRQKTILFHDVTPEIIAAVLREKL